MRSERARSPGTPECQYFHPAHSSLSLCVDHLLSLSASCLPVSLASPRPDAAIPPLDINQYHHIKK